MTHPRPGRRPTPKKPSAITWQYVALTLIGAAFFLGIFVLIPDDQPQLRSALLGVLILAGQAAVTRFLGQIKRQVNGRMTELISSLDKAHETISVLRDERDVSRETSTDVSRETKPRKRDR